MSTRPFVQTESHKHRLAKELLASWLMDEEKTNDFCNLSPFSWRTNYGVFTELPFHEKDDAYYFECSEGLLNYEARENIADKRAWFDSKFDRGKILFVPDITVFHKGSPRLIIEVVHRNAVSDKKLNRIKEFFLGHCCEVWEVAAEEILRHTGVPKELIAFKICET